MTACEIYDKLIESYKEGNKNHLSYYAETWMSLKLENPFPEGNPAKDMYYNAMLNYSRWQAGGIDSRRSRIWITKYARNMAELNIPNPYKEAVKPKIEKKVKTEEPVHILGVLPETQTAESAEEKATEKKHIFGKRKKG